jgi:hypothetical protein
MFARLSSLLLLFLLALSASGGIPMHAPEQGECPMASGMQSMDCCKKAQQQNVTSEVISAKLCCSLDCQTGGPVSSTGRGNLSIQTLPASQPGGVAATSTIPIPFLFNEGFIERRITSNDDHPAYIRHLSLLI